MCVHCLYFYYAHLFASLVRPSLFMDDFQTPKELNIWRYRNMIIIVVIIIIMITGWLDRLCPAVSTSVLRRHLVDRYHLITSRFFPRRGSRMLHRPPVVAVV